MDVLKLGKKLLAQMLVMIFIISGCMPSDTPSTRNLASNSKTGTTAGSGNGAFPGDGVAGDGSSLPPKVEIRHLIEPNLSYDPTYTTGTGYAGGGSYVRKLTLPKNYAGKLYVAGINISSLVSRHVRVRFKFGVNREVVTVPATIVQAPGITPQTPISVLVLDLRSEPFRNVRLSYDLFDYNEYSFDQDASASTDGMLTEPVSDNRNSGLYCRGLKLEDDPTFTGVGACDGREFNPDQPEEECLYAYAKVADQGLIKQTGTLKVPLSPTRPQVLSNSGTDYFKEIFSQQILKTLPDTIPSAANNFSSFVFDNDTTTAATTNMVFNTTWAGKVVGTSTYFYRGPYRLVDTIGWQFRFQSLDGPKGLFKKDSFVNYDTLVNGTLTDNPVYYDYLSDGTPITLAHQRLYYNSLMYPRATKLSLSPGIQHLSSTDVISTRAPTTVSPGQKTAWMDGSNARAQSINTEFNHVGSCNVSASIEVLATDDNGNEYIISQAKDVKLQLVRPTQYRTDIGNEVLYTNFKSCASNTQCGGSECCFNSRCWDEALVSQCFDDSLVQGNKNVGQSCTTDLQCTSLCCNRTIGQCAPHNTSLNPAVNCAKPVGEFCIAKEWCQKYPITKKLLITSDNKLTCDNFTYQVQEYGDCRNSACVPPVQPVQPDVDVTAPGACNNAVPVPTFN